MARAPSLKKVLAMSQREYLPEAIREVRRLKEGAKKAGSWSAVERFQRQEADLLKELHELRAGESSEDVPRPEIAMATVILPAVAKWPRPFLEQLFEALAQHLGVRLDALRGPDDH